MPVFMRWFLVGDISDIGVRRALAALGFLLDVCDYQKSKRNPKAATSRRTPKSKIVLWRVRHADKVSNAAHVSGPDVLVHLQLHPHLQSRFKQPAGQFHWRHRAEDGAEQHGET